MKFYVCADHQGESFDCETNYLNAVEIVDNAGGGSVVMMDISVSSESIRRLLGNIGGYVKTLKSFEVK